MAERLACAKYGEEALISLASRRFLFGSPPLLLAHDDILLMIIDAALDLALKSWPSLDRQNAARTISHTCSRLRYLILNRGACWSHIFVCDKANERELLTTLDRSQTAPLTLCISTYPEAGHWRAIFFGGERFPWPSVFLKIGLQFERVVQLDVMHVRGRAAEWVPRIPPEGIQALSLKDVEMPTHIALVGPSTTRLVLRQFGVQALDLYTALVRAVHLRTLHLDGLEFTNTEKLPADSTIVSASLEELRFSLISTVAVPGGIQFVTKVLSAAVRSARHVHILPRFAGEEWANPAVNQLHISSEEMTSQFGAARRLSVDVDGAQYTIDFANGFQRTFALDLDDPCPQSSLLGTVEEFFLSSSIFYAEHLLARIQPKTWPHLRRVSINLPIARGSLQVDDPVLPTFEDLRNVLPGDDKRIQAPYLQDVELNMDFAPDAVPDGLSEQFLARTTAIDGAVILAYFVVERSVNVLVRSRHSVEQISDCVRAALGNISGVDLSRYRISS